MSSVLGSFQSCADGNFSASFTCSGSSCAGLQKIPGITCTNSTSGPTTCTNGNKCTSNSNLTSSFAVQGSGLTITQSHNITISGHNFTLVGTNGNFTNTTVAAAHSAAYPSPRPSLKWLVLFGFLLFSAQVFAKSPDSAELGAIFSEYDPVLGSLLGPLQVAMCDLVRDAPKDNEFELALLEFGVLEVCLADLMVSLFGLVGTLVEGDTNATAYGSTLPVSDPEALLTAAVGDTMLCLEVAQALINDPSGGSAANICAPILAAAPTSTAALPTATGTVQQPPTATNDLLPPSWPPSSVWTSNGNLGSCAACRISQWLLTVRQYSTCNAGNSDNGNPYGGLNITNPPITAYDIQTNVCDASFRGQLGFQAACDYMCKNNKCQTYFYEAIVQSMGSAYDPQAYGTDRSKCSTLCNSGLVDSSYDLPPFYCDATGMGALQPGTKEPTCRCGTGALACLPLNPKTGACYVLIA